MHVPKFRVAGTVYETDSSSHSSLSDEDVDSDRVNEKLVNSKAITKVRGVHKLKIVQLG